MSQNFSDQQSPSALETRVLEKSDYPEIMKIQEEAQKDAPQDWFVISNESELDTCIERRSSFGMYDQGKLVGVCAAYAVSEGAFTHSEISNDKINAGEACSEFFYCVDPAYRKKGVAKALLEKSLKHEKELGTRHVVASVHPKNQASIKILSNYGFMAQHMGELYGGKSRLLASLDLTKLEA